MPFGKSMLPPGVLFQSWCAPNPPPGPHALKQKTFGEATLWLSRGNINPYKRLQNAEFSLTYKCKLCCLGLYTACQAYEAISAKLTLEAMTPMYDSSVDFQTSFFWQFGVQGLWFADCGTELTVRLSSPAFRCCGAKPCIVSEAFWRPATCYIIWILGPSGLRLAGRISRFENL